VLLQPIKERCHKLRSHGVGVFVTYRGNHTYLVEIFEKPLSPEKYIWASSSVGSRAAAG
jgi:hypothetical protein